MLNLSPRHGNLNYFMPSYVQINQKFFVEDFNKPLIYTSHLYTIYKYIRNLVV
jgi:hypothetical protein